MLRRSQCVVEQLVHRRFERSTISRVAQRTIAAHSRETLATTLSRICRLSEEHRAIQRVLRDATVKASSCGKNAGVSMLAEERDTTKRIAGRRGCVVWWLANGIAAGSPLSLKICSFVFRFVGESRKP